MVGVEELYGSVAALGRLRTADIEVKENTKEMKRKHITK